MILNLKDDINEGMLQLLIDAYNKLEFTGTGELERLTIYFSSNGGENTSTAAIIDLINKNKDITTIIAYENLLSNGFRLFYAVECDRELLDTTIGMYHLTRNEGVRLYEGLKDQNHSYDLFVKKKLNNFNYLNSTHKLVEFTEEELQEIKNHNDMWFDYKRLKQMLKYNLKNND